MNLLVTGQVISQFFAGYTPGVAQCSYPTYKHNFRCMHTLVCYRPRGNQQKMSNFTAAAWSPQSLWSCVT